MAEEIDRISDIIKEINPDYEDPIEEHKLVYDSASEGLEPVYFFILDRMNEFFPDGVEKFVDSFTSSPGSGHFSEMGLRGTKMQEEAMKSLGMVNTLIKGIINLIYDLRNFETRLASYEKAKSEDPKESWAGILGLKQVWLDSVDIKRGRGSIHAMAQELDFATLRDSFMLAESVEKIDEMDLNERVKYILKPRLQEFFEWKDKSEKELQKRYDMEKAYLKSQVESLKLYTRWAKPYLMAATKLEQKQPGRKAEVVTAFNTILLNLVLFGKKTGDPEKLLVSGDLPKPFKKVKWKRKYHECVLVEFFFRGIPHAIGGGRYTFGGRTEVVFRSYVLKDEEIERLSEKLSETDIGDALRLVEGLTEESLKQLQEDINYYLEEGEREKKIKMEKEGEEKGTNPFFALIGLGKKKKEEVKEKKEEIKKNGEIRKDDFYEGELRKILEKEAKKSCFSLFDIYKKAHGMVSHPSPY
jgi:hypothetical protein